MFILVEQLKELVKSYTVAAAIANETKSQSDFDYASKLLDQVNNIRLNLGMQAEMRQVFWDKVTVPAAANANTVQNNWYSRNDQNYILKRGIADLDDSATISLLNQGDKFKVITRESVAWQTIMSCVQTNTNGLQTLLDFTEPLTFAANQALNVGIQGQTDAGIIYFHGATIKDRIPDGLAEDLKNEFLNPADDNGYRSTKYLPQSQLVPLIFQFASSTRGTLATDPQGNNDIFSVKNDRSFLALGVSTMFSGQYTVDKLTDEARNHTFCTRVSIEGIAAKFDSPYENYYDLPFPHLLRAGSRFKFNALNGGNFSGNGTVEANTNTQLVFHGISL